MRVTSGSAKKEILGSADVLVVVVADAPLALVSREQRVEVGSKGFS